MGVIQTQTDLYWRIQCVHTQVGHTLNTTTYMTSTMNKLLVGSLVCLFFFCLHQLIARPWQIIPKDWLFFISQIFSLLFSQTKLAHYSYIVLKLVLKNFAKHSDDIYISSQKQQKLIAMTSARPCALNLTPKVLLLAKLTLCICGCNVECKSLCVL